jgi:acyl carrier protein
VLTKDDVRTAVIREINTLLLEDEDADEVAPLTGEEALHDLSLNSLMLARLIITLEAEVGADPFGGGELAVSDIRTVNDLVAAYENVLAPAGA